MQVSIREDNLEAHVEVDTADVDEIASVDEDCSRGMKSTVYTSDFYHREVIFHALFSFHNEKDILYCIQIHSKECHY
jgi:hypothetical protein